MTNLRRDMMTDLVAEAAEAREMRQNRIGEAFADGIRSVAMAATAYKAGWDAGIEAAASVCDDKSESIAEWVWDGAASMSLQSAADEIRALAKPALWPEHIATPTDQPLNQE